MNEHQSTIAAALAAVRQLREAGTPTDAGPQYADGWTHALDHAEGALLAIEERSK